MSITVEAFQMEGWKETFTGLVLAENDEWVMIAHIPSEYFVDGYRLVRKEYIVQRIRKSAEQRAERVLRLRKVDYAAPKGFAWGDTEELLRWVESRYDLFQFQDREEDDVMVGRVDVVDDGFLQIIFVDIDGQEDETYDMEFPLSEILIIEFGTNYMDSVRLLWKDNGNGN
jgi:hypothetical protein